MTDTSGQGASGRHLAATAIYILEKFQINTPGLKDAAGKLLKDEPENPYLEFLANGKPTANMEAWVTKQCPDVNFDKSRQVPRYQWSWERQDSKAAAAQSMYWDCIFAGDLIQRGMRPITLSKEIKNYLPKIEDVLTLIQETKDAFEAQLKFAADKLTDLRTAKNQLDQLLRSVTSAVDAAAKGIIPKYDPEQVFSHFLRRPATRR